eukprot:gene23919-11410_t
MRRGIVLAAAAAAAAAGPRPWMNTQDTPGRKGVYHRRAPSTSQMPPTRAHLPTPLLLHPFAEERARKLVAEMTTDEKLVLFHGSCDGYGG